MKTAEQRLKDYLEKRGFSIEERYEETGFVYFGGDKRVFWKTSGEGAEKAVELFESWGSPSQAEANDIMTALGMYLAIPLTKKPA